MSLKARIIILTVSVTATIVIALFLVQLTNVIESWTNSSLEIAQLAGQQVKHLLVVRLEERSPGVPSSLAPAELWAGVLRDDRNLASLLEATMAQAPSIIEISIAGADGTVVASSNPLRPSHPLAKAPDLRTLTQLGPLSRANLVFRGASDYELRIPLGLAQQQQPLFTIQVLVSSVLLRGDLIPAMQRVAEWGLAALVASIILAYASARLSVGSLTRLGRVIDQISSGSEPGAPSAGGHASPEFAVLESKLNLLGHQVRGAREDVTQLRSNVQKLLEGLEESILLFDATGRLVLCGGASERLLGVSIEAVAGRYVADVFPPNTELGSAAREAFLRHRNVKDLAVGHLLLNVEFMPASQEPGRFTALMTVRDARHHQQLESQLGQSARLDAMSRITSSVAHEIKNPLNSIAARLDYLQSWATSDFPEAEEEIQTIFREVNRLDRVVRTFLDFTRPVELAEQEIDVVALTQEIACLLQPDAARRQVSVRFTGAPGPILVRGDEDLLKEAILNIATNGIEAMPGGGELNIGVTRENRHCSIAISDQGPGIPESEREKIFELYFTTKQNGSGLGLPMSYRAIQLHGGAINLESESGRGTTFYLRLPVMESGGDS